MIGSGGFVGFVTGRDDEDVLARPEPAALVAAATRRDRERGREQRCRRNRADGPSDSGQEVTPSAVARATCPRGPADRRTSRAMVPVATVAPGRGGRARSTPARRAPPPPRTRLAHSSITTAPCARHRSRLMTPSHCSGNPKASWCTSWAVNGAPACARLASRVLRRESNSRTPLMIGALGGYLTDHSSHREGKSPDTGRSRAARPHRRLAGARRPVRLSPHVSRPRALPLAARRPRQLAALRPPGRHRGGHRLGQDRRRDRGRRRRAAPRPLRARGRAVACAHGAVARAAHRGAPRRADRPPRRQRQGRPGRRATCSSRRGTRRPRTSRSRPGSRAGS